MRNPQCPITLAIMNAMLEVRDFSANDREVDSDRFITELQSMSDAAPCRTIVYCGFPIYRDFEDNPLETDYLAILQDKGVFLIQALAYREDSKEETPKERLEKLCAHLYSRLLKHSALRKGMHQLAFNIYPCFYDPEKRLDSQDDSVLLLHHASDLWRIGDPSRAGTFNIEALDQLLPILEGSDVLRVKRTRVKSSGARDDRYRASLDQLENEMARFDESQRSAIHPANPGFQRIRGLAGSGKTVVLAMKAAITALREPKTEIIVTFWTKSLYQHVQDLVTRFYRTQDDRPPNAKLLRIMHGWGGKNASGVYYEICRANNIIPMTLRGAQIASPNDEPFDTACKRALDEYRGIPIADYIMIDEGQDFPTSFVRLCTKAARLGVIIAFDELQNIFQTGVPSIEELTTDATERTHSDLMLRRCYRNPRPIIVVAHAIGFGLYGKRPVQMLENRSHWEDIGYQIEKGTFTPHSETVIQRPKSHSIAIIEDTFSPDEIIRCEISSDINDETEWVAQAIQTDIKNGLLPEDILVVSADSRNAKNYLARVARKLQASGIQVNNTHTDQFNLHGFVERGAVTLTTVQKSKGNEAFMVYVVGCDAQFLAGRSVRARNMIFVAMTRAKAWLRLSGIGAPMEKLVTEIREAKKRYPKLVFQYPTQEEITSLKRDLVSNTTEAESTIEELQEILRKLPADQVKEILDNWDRKSEQ